MAGYYSAYIVFYFLCRLALNTFWTLDSGCCVGSALSLQNILCQNFGNCLTFDTSMKTTL